MKTRQMLLTAMFIAVVTVSTYIRIHVPLGTGGLIHIGTLTMFTIALRFGRRYGAISGGVGMALFDLFSEWVIWAPGTLVIRFIAGFLVGHIAMSKHGQGESRVRNLLACLAGGLVIVVGYFIYESIFLGTGLAALASVLGNVAQLIIGLLAIFILPSIPRLKDLQG